jgi:hypothetical protein
MRFWTVSLPRSPTLQRWGDASRIDRIARLEKLRAATAALQVAESVRFAQSQVAEQMAANVDPEAIGRGIAEQIGLAYSGSLPLQRHG